MDHPLGRRGYARRTERHDAVAIGARRRAGKRLAIRSRDPAPSSGRVEVLADDSGVTSRDPEEGDGGALGVSPSLLPIPKRVNADTHGLSELGLSESDKPPQRGNVIPGLEDAGGEALSNARGNGPGEVLLREFRDVSHGCCPG